MASPLLRDGGNAIAGDGGRSGDRAASRPALFRAAPPAGGRHRHALPGARPAPARAGVDVVAVSPADPAEVPLPPGTARRFVAGRLAEILAGCDGAVAQGQLANDLLLECPELPVAIDLYDPWLVENLHYAAELGLDPYRNDHATWVLQLSRGDFFLCSSEEQRLYYLGFLTALGRVNPRRLEMDPDLDGLIAPVPFGVPERAPAPPAVPRPARHDRRSARAAAPLRRPLRLVRPGDPARRPRVVRGGWTGAARTAGASSPAGPSSSSAIRTPKARPSACCGRSRAGAARAAGGGAGQADRLGTPGPPLGPAARRRRPGRPPPPEPGDAALHADPLPRGARRRLPGGDLRGGRRLPPAPAAPGGLGGAAGRPRRAGRRHRAGPDRDRRSPRGAAAARGRARRPVLLGPGARAAGRLLPGAAPRPDQGGFRLPPADRGAAGRPRLPGPAPVAAHAARRGALAPGGPGDSR